METEEKFFTAHNWLWIFVTGLFFVILGVTALAIPVVSTIGLTLALGSIFFVSSILHFAQAVKLRHEQGSLTRFFQGFLSFILGSLMMAFPVPGAIGLNLMLIFYFFTSGVFQWLLSSSLKPAPGTFMARFSALVSMFIGAFMLMTFPQSALWMPGTLLGIDLSIAGGALMGFAIVLRKTRRHSELRSFHHAT